MDRYGSRPTWLYGHSTDAHSVRPGRTDMAQANLATPQLHTVSVQDGQIWLKANMAVWPQHRCTQCPSRTDRYGSSQPGYTTAAHSVRPGRTDIAQDQPGYATAAHSVRPGRTDIAQGQHGYATAAHSVRPGRTDIAQGQHGCMATAQMHTVSVQDGQIWLKPTWLHHSCT